MLPRDLKAEQFAGYPPQARALVVAHLDALQQLPLSFLPSLLREEWFHAVSHVSLSLGLEQFDWINQPGQFVEQLSAYLWTTHQLDAFREAATTYGNRLRSAEASEPLPVRRLGIAVIGQGVASYDAPLFQNLRQHGTYFGRVKPENGVDLLLAVVAARAKAHPVPSGHWSIDGGPPADHSPLLTCVSYQTLEPVRAALLSNIQTEIKKPGMGPEELRTHLARLSPADVAMDKAGDPVLDRFQVKLFTEGSGTQIFSTTFAQWTAREALRRAQALTLLTRYAPRQRQRPMNELLSNSHINPELDFTGSLIDADMGAYYQWINQQRLPGSEKSSFLVWFEGHSQALAIGPTLPRATESNSSIGLTELLELATG
jgi:hypothetical protein